MASEKSIPHISAHEEGDRLIIESPFPNAIVSFNNEEGYPDLSFVVLPSKRTFRVHKRTLVDCSDILKILDGSLKETRGWT